MSWSTNQDMAFFLSQGRTEDVVALGRLMEEGKVVPVIDRTYPAAEIVEAMTYLETGRARGKVVITMD
jgi:NADPH:quinone reductase-like Zn-dependent oxidoreductase